MARINAGDIDKYKSKSNFFKLEDDGDIARGQILCNSMDDLPVFVCHEVEVGGNYKRQVSCLREYNDPVDDCPLCAAGYPVKTIILIPFFDHDTQEIKLWQRGPNFKKKLESFFSRHKNVEDLVVEIERCGAKGDQHTTYEIYPVPDEDPYDVSELDKPDYSKVCLEKTAEEMQEFLDCGDFPNPDGNDSKPVRRNRNDGARRSSRASGSDNAGERPSRRRATSRSVR